MKKIIALLFSAGLIFTVGCHHKKNAELLLDLVHKYSYGLKNICYQTKSSVNCATSVVDVHTHKDGRVVVEGTEFGVINYLGLDMTTFPSLLEQLKNDPNDTVKNSRINGWIVANSTRLIWDASADSYRDKMTYEIFSEASVSVKDLELMGANLESFQNENLGESLAINYGLSTERSTKIARLITQYQKLSTKRSLTPTEKNYFSNELLGTNYDNAFNSLTTGQELDNLLEKAADLNGTSPEAVSTILSEIFL